MKEIKEGSLQSEVRIQLPEHLAGLLSRLDVGFNDNGLPKSWPTGKDWDRVISNVVSLMSHGSHKETPAHELLRRLEDSLSYVLSLITKNEKPDSSQQNSPKEFSQRPEDFLLSLWGEIGNLADILKCPLLRDYGMILSIRLVCLTSAASVLINNHFKIKDVHAESDTIIKSCLNTYHESCEFIASELKKRVRWIDSSEKDRSENLLNTFTSQELLSGRFDSNIRKDLEEQGKNLVIKDFLPESQFHETVLLFTDCLTVPRDTDIVVPESLQESWSGRSLETSSLVATNAEDPDIKYMLGKLDKFAQIPLSFIPVAGPLLSLSLDLITEIFIPEPKSPWIRFKNELMHAMDLKIGDHISSDINSKLKAFKDDYNLFISDVKDNEGQLDDTLKIRAVSLIQQCTNDRATILYIDDKPECAIPFLAEVIENSVTIFGLMGKVGSYNIKEQIKTLYKQLSIWFVTTVDNIYYSRKSSYSDMDESDFWDSKRQLMDTRCDGWITSRWKVTGKYHHRAWEAMVRYTKYKAGLGALTHRLVQTGILETLTQLEHQWHTEIHIDFDSVDYRGRKFDTIAEFYRWFIEDTLIYLVNSLYDITLNRPDVGYPWFFDHDCDDCYLWNRNDEIYRYYERDYVVSQLKAGKNWWIPADNRTPSKGIPEWAKYQETAIASNTKNSETLLEMREVQSAGLGLKTPTFLSKSQSEETIVE